MSFRYARIKASFVLIERYLFHYMAESSGSLVASQESNQGSHPQCGCERAFIFVFALSNISLFATDIAVFYCNACKGESSQEKSNRPVKKYICDFRLIVVQYDPVDFIFKRLSLF